MKLLNLVCCLFLVALIGQTNAIETSEEPETTISEISTTPLPTVYTYITTSTPPSSTTQYTTTTRYPPSTTTKFTTTTRYPPTKTTKFTTIKPTRTTPTTTVVPTTPEASKKPCGSNDLGDYRGGCDESVPVIIMPKGRPIMERVLDWFKCGTKSCLPEKR